MIGRNFRSLAVFKALSAARKAGTIQAMFRESIEEDLKTRYAMAPVSLNGNREVLAKQNFTAGLIYQLMHHEPVFDSEKQKEIVVLFSRGHDEKQLPTVAKCPSLPTWGHLQDE